MSRTDKDRPYVVRKFDELDGGLYYRHDHRNGTCEPETFENARRGYNHPNHYRVCKKRDVIEFECEPKNPCTTYYTSWGLRYEGRSRCHRTELFRDDNNRLSYKRFGCVGHRITFYDNEIPCTCDDFPVWPHCYADTDHQRAWYSWAPHAVVQAVYTRPERQRERIDLRKAAREYNAHGELEDYDFANRQSRHSAAWYYW